MFQIQINKVYIIANDEAKYVYCTDTCARDVLRLSFNFLLSDKESGGFA